MNQWYSFFVLTALSPMISLAFLPGVLVVPNLLITLNEWTLLTDIRSKVYRLC